MRAKSRQINPKDLKRLELLLMMLQIVLACLARVPGLSHLKTFQEPLLWAIQVIKDAEPLADSGNSNKPSGKDIQPAKKREKKSNGKMGGQPGHPGTTLRQSKNPDKIVYVLPDRDKYINDPDHELPDDNPEKRRVVELVTYKFTIEYRKERFRNRKTGEIISGEFPDGVNAPVQYGDSVKKPATILNVWNCIPFERVAGIFESFFQIDLCPATVYNLVRAASEKPTLDTFETAAVKSLSESDCAGADETGCKTNKKMTWVHNLVNTMFTLFHPHAKRGKEAMDDMGILGKMLGFLVHDCWASYFKFDNVTHCICNAHIVRELTRVIEKGQKWAIDMKELLLDLDSLVDSYGGVLPPHLQNYAHKRFRSIIKDGYTENEGWELARPPGKPGRRGKKPKSKALNLLERLTLHEEAVLRFMTNKIIPWSNIIPISG